MANYEVEDLEDQAMKKSNAAKKIIAGAGAVAAGSGATFAATQLANGSETPAADITGEELVGAVTDGVTEESMAEDEKPVEEPKETKHHEPKPQVKHEDNHEVKEDDVHTTSIYNENGEKMVQIDEGQYKGKNFAFIDVDGDGVADYFAYDENNDKQFQPDEIREIGKENIAMMEERENDVRIVVPNETIAEIRNDPYNIDPEEPITEIPNDYIDEKTGERYSNDIAQNSRDYNNHVMFAGNDGISGVEVEEVPDNYIVEEVSVEVADDDLIMANEDHSGSISVEVDEPVYDEPVAETVEDEPIAEFEDESYIADNNDFNDDFQADIDTI